jgi:hypothetical protein
MRHPYQKLFQLRKRMIALLDKGYLIQFMLLLCQHKNPSQEVKIC